MQPGSTVIRRALGLAYVQECRKKGITPNETITNTLSQQTNDDIELNAIFQLGSFGNEHVIALYSAFNNSEEHLRRLSKLSLDGNNISGPGMRPINGLLVLNPSLTTLELSHNPIGDEGVHTLCQALIPPRNPAYPRVRLQRLNLSDCGLSDFAATRIAEMLKHNTDLRVLELSTTGRPAGHPVMPMDLHSNPELADFVTDLQAELAVERQVTVLGKSTPLNSAFFESHGNDIGPMGATALAQALSVNRSIQTLNILGNAIGNEGFRNLVTHATGHTSLRTLGLSVFHRSQFPAAGEFYCPRQSAAHAFPRFVNLLRSTPHLTRLDLGWVIIGPLRHTSTPLPAPLAMADTFPAEPAMTVVEDEPQGPKPVTPGTPVILHTEMRALARKQREEGKAAEKKQEPAAHSPGATSTSPTPEKKRRTKSPGNKRRHKSRETSADVLSPSLGRAYGRARADSVEGQPVSSPLVVVRTQQAMGVTNDDLKLRRRLVETLKQSSPAKRRAAMIPEISTPVFRFSETVAPPAGRRDLSETQPPQSMPSRDAPKAPALRDSPPARTAPEALQSPPKRPPPPALPAPVDSDTESEDDSPPHRPPIPVKPAFISNKHRDATKQAEIQRAAQQQARIAELEAAHRMEIEELKSKHEETVAAVTADLEARTAVVQELTGTVQTLTGEKHALEVERDSLAARVSEAKAAAAEAADDTKKRVTALKAKMTATYEAKLDALRAELESARKADADSFAAARDSWQSTENKLRTDAKDLALKAKTLAAEKDALAAEKEAVSAELSQTKETSAETHEEAKRMARRVVELEDVTEQLLAQLKERECEVVERPRPVSPESTAVAAQTPSPKADPQVQGGEHSEEPVPTTPTVETPEPVQSQPRQMNVDTDTQLKPEPEPVPEPKQPEPAPEPEEPEKPAQSPVKAAPEVDRRPMIAIPVRRPVVSDSDSDWSDDESPVTTAPPKASAILIKAEPEPEVEPQSGPAPEPKRQIHLSPVTMGKLDRPSPALQSSVMAVCAGDRLAVYEGKNGRSFVVAV
ncbi:Leucine Rich repeat [Carpediemonas membranifera]|uniref:Leucine Rich repeat n=1 Tax=Carpediemonas membranifera TaxID=201153 RepID=A0A8J6DYZ6_9EUKA|nr:Leucine Rich repeat [Carpediemonas membranifera]|eukprot:KAG9392934.1 Leucine Rich repeat [Carpediemonas membranifera]